MLRKQKDPEPVRFLLIENTTATASKPTQTTNTNPTKLLNVHKWPPYLKIFYNQQLYWSLTTDTNTEIMDQKHNLFVFINRPMDILY